MSRLAWRNLVNNVMLSLTAVCTLLTVSTLFLILGYLVYNGGKSLDWNFFTQLPKGPGETGGGMANAIVGTAKLVGLASVMGIPIGFIAGIYLSEFGGVTFPFIIRYVADLLNGVPSIVVGIFAYAIVVLPLKHFSAWAGSVALAVMLIPVVVRNTEQFLQGVPQSLREGALSLGASKWRTIVTVVVPASISGILTGIILGVARIAGETAPLIFTSFGNQFWSRGFNEPTSSLPVMIYNYAISPYDDWHRQAWAAGLVLLALVLVSNILARGVLTRGIAANRG
jgi:phosphate transport system permease protein